jgi:NADP-dependent 3-hydroxy acid dehydrogenase YdfG
LITGASSGIGAATAEALASRGWRTILVARNHERLAEVEARIATQQGQAVVEALDCADGDAVLAMATRVTSEFGAPHLIVASAGAGCWCFIEEAPPAEGVQMMGAPYLAAYNVVHAFMAGMLQRRSGHIIHVGSPAAFMPWPGATGYTATRWALRGLHEALCQDLVATGVRSSHVVFGEVSSDYFTNNPDSHQHLPKIAGLVPVTSPSRCAEVILGVIRRPRRLIMYPFMLRLFYWQSLAVPWFVRWLLHRTGRRH